jgi:hypothetical protein
MKAKLKKESTRYNLIDIPSGWLIGSTGDDILKSFTGEERILYKLSKQNCDEIFGVTDVDKLAREWHNQQNFNGLSDNIISIGYLNMFKDGFNKAMELNGFTLDDMRTAYSDGALNIDRDGEPIDNPDDDFIDTIERIKSKTEIDVMIVMEDVKYFRMAQRLKLDSLGCLILKRAV